MAGEAKKLKEVTMFFTQEGKKIYLYTVSRIDNKKKFLTIVCTKKEAFEFINKVIKVTNYKDFLAWCEFQKVNPKSDAAWNKYFDTCISREEKNQYCINKVFYHLKDMVAIMRMFGGSVPLGCSFDTKEEYEYLKYKLELEDLTSSFEGELSLDGEEQ